jgi:hypothetical protein
MSERQIEGIPAGYRIKKIGFARTIDIVLNQDANTKIILEKIEEPTSFLIEAGKWCRLRNGAIVGPIEPQGKRYWRCGSLFWNQDGSSKQADYLDIVEVVPKPQPPKPKPQPPKPTYIPWTYETCPRGCWVRFKDSGAEMAISVIFYSGVTAGVNYWNFDRLLQEFEQLDGSPCGTEVSE